MNTKKVILCIAAGVIVGASLGIIGKLLEVPPVAVLFVVTVAGAAVGAVIGVNEVKYKIKNYS